MKKEPATTPYLINLPKKDYRELKEKAKELGVSVSFIIKVLIRDFLKSNKKITIGGEL